ncbi:acyl-CoA thioesterase [Lactiplantibacillus dongliensis]|uniref:Acyl-CoA thioesterase n=1 Tax=Lactiplantibacillus dongliensis TaxID=2559919 RepID=A0ABW1R787_9LACO|nr:hotdog domain-containing protein [Lactiplantibacillus dongliensis]
MEKNTFYQVESGDFFVDADMLNHLNILHGGVLVKHCDSTIGLLANRYTHSRVLTVAIKEFNFAKPAHVGDHISFSVTLLKTSRHTMTFHVEVRRQTYDSDPVAIGNGIFIFIAVNADLKPIPVPAYTVQDPEQQAFIKQIREEFAV